MYSEQFKKAYQFALEILSETENSLDFFINNPFTENSKSYLDSNSTLINLKNENIIVQMKLDDVLESLQ